MIRDRRLLLLPIGAAHVFAFVALQAVRAEATSPAPMKGISLISVPGPRAAVEPPVAFTLAAIEADVPPPALNGEPAETAAPAPGAGSDCDLTEAVQATLRSSATVRAALAALPAADRSVANAVMLWDGGWVEGASPEARPALLQIRAVVAATVRGASAACREMPQAGPRLIAISGPPDTVLALGSGRWRWGDLASP